MSAAGKSVVYNLHKAAIALDSTRLALQRSLSLGVSRCSTTFEDDALVANLLSDTVQNPTTIYLKVGYDPVTKSHTLDPDFVRESLFGSDIVRLSKENPNIIVKAIAHNPEEIKMGGGDFLERLSSSLGAFSSSVSDGTVSSFGVSSNGLSLPSTHPLHLPLAELLLTVESPPFSLSPSSFDTVMFPFNPLETLGTSQIPLSRSFDSISYRPLLAYPDGGTGDGHPFKLVDHVVPTGVEGGKLSTHLMNEPPSQYEDALKMAMGHFDAEALVSESGDRTLTPEERETVDGCKLLQGLLVEQDRMLSSVRSVPVYTSSLSTSVIPLIQENFEEMDEESSDVLAEFFRWHGIAVRCHTAWKTRRLLIEGGEDGTGEHHKIPTTSTLQSYSLEYSLAQKGIDMVEIGMPKVEYVEDLLMGE